jgi:dihydroneopterin aldolase
VREEGSAATDVIAVDDLRLWAHVGVLERERQLGQWFRVAFRIGADLSTAGRSDALADSHDYALAITALQRQARSIRCRTLEHYSERMLDLLEDLYGPVPLQLELVKCRAPIAGFDGRVAVRRSRRWPTEA